MEDLIQLENDYLIDSEGDPQLKELIRVRQQLEKETEIYLNDQNE